MHLGQKKKYAGVLYRLSADVVVLDTGNGPPLQLRSAKGMPFKDAGLDTLVGRRVSVQGIAGSGVPAIFIERLSDIAPLPKQPRKPGL